MTDTKQPKYINAKRRGFLQGAAVAGGAVASGAAVSGESLDNTIDSEVPDQPQQGYRKSDHVKRYYARARF